MSHKTITDARSQMHAKLNREVYIMWQCQAELIKVDQHSPSNVATNLFFLLLMTCAAAGTEAAMIFILFGRFIL